MLYGGSVGIEITRPGYHLGRIPASKGKTYPVEILTPDEVRALLAQCSQTSSYGIRHRALIVMLYRTGLRCGEALALHVKDIDVQGRRSHGAGEFPAKSVERDHVATDHAHVRTRRRCGRVGESDEPSSSATE